MKGRRYWRRGHGMFRKCLNRCHTMQRKNKALRSTWSFVSLALGRRFASLGGSIFDFRIHFPSGKDRHSAHVKPHQQDDNGAKRTVRRAKRVKEVQIDTENE